MSVEEEDQNLWKTRIRRLVTGLGAISGEQVLGKSWALYLLEIDDEN
ncbi:MAG: hypothetical protein WCA38_01200 [Candidatus Acidiferrales bacterium]